jgi:hypothetical protein
LCIIQNDIDDWNYEAVQMAKVYGGSYVTLAALHTEDCDGGLFSTTASKYDWIPLPAINIEGQEYDILTPQQLPQVHSWRSMDHKSCTTPLFNRAWAYQERLVASRVLYFAKNELLWECFQCMACECLEDESTEYMMPSARSTVALKCPKLEHRKQLTENKAKGRWCNMVEEYSALSLTMHKDRLPAISAHAAQIQTYRPNDRYLAGLWCKTLLDDMLWSRLSGSRIIAAPRDTFAPTWSWASVADRTHYNWIPEDENQVERPQIVDVVCHYIQNEHHGHVDFGRIVLLGKLVPCTLRLDDYKEWYHIFLTSPFFGTMSVSSIVLDCDFESRTEVKSTHEGVHTVHFLQMAEDVSHLYCLLLVKQIHRPIYRRIGMMCEELIPADDERLRLYKYSVKKKVDKLKRMFCDIPQTEVTIE